jgi:Tfp pilus assembly protein PilV
MIIRQHRQFFTVGRVPVRGMSLVEALVALLIIGFGLLALSMMQLNLSRNADVSRQRSEAIRLAERHIDKLRSYTGISSGTINWNALSTVTTDSIAQSNTSYTLTTTLGGATTDAMRSVEVSVAWNDRTGAAQSVALASVIANSDPLDIGNMVNPLPMNTPLKRPKNRNINIPIPALDLGNGTSSYAFDATRYVIFSNISGNVVQVCNPGTGTTTATVSQILAASCQAFTGYILAGYVYTTNTSFPTGVNLAGVTLNTALSGQPTFCQIAAATNQNTGSTISNYKYYLCVMPLDSPFLWGGTVRLTGVPTSSNNLVCRFQYTQTAVTVNERNIQPYVDVNQSLDEQNYQMATSSSSTTTSLAGSTSACPSAMTVSGVSVGVVHQDCRLANAARGSECP